MEQYNGPTPTSGVNASNEHRSRISVLFGVNSYPICTKLCAVCVALVGAKPNIWHFGVSNDRSKCVNRSTSSRISVVFGAIWCGLKCASRSEPDLATAVRWRRRRPQPTERNWIQKNLATPRKIWQHQTCGLEHSLKIFHYITP